MATPKKQVRKATTRKARAARPRKAAGGPDGRQPTGVPALAAGFVIVQDGQLIVVRDGLYVISTDDGHHTPIRIAGGVVEPITDPMACSKEEALEEALAWLRGYKAAVEAKTA